MKFLIPTLFVLLGFINAQDTQESMDGCWLSAYGRGVGKAISACGEGQEKDGLLCYPTCDSGYYGVGPVCWQSCPSDFKDTGLDCLKPSAYGRGAGYVIWEKSKCEKENSQGCEKSGLLWYPNCKEGFHAVGCCVCSPDCQDGMTDIGISCAKKSYGRTAGTPLGCPQGQDEDASLCYPQCSEGYHGIGPVCWGSCPTGFSQCGALCTNGTSCSSHIADLGQQAIQGIEKVLLDDENSDSKDMKDDILMTLAQLAGGLIYPICNQ